MKFLCIACDEPMKMSSAKPPDSGGSIAAVFGCPTCTHQIAMLTNAHETQLVQSLGVKIGPGDTNVAAVPAGAASGEAPAASGNAAVADSAAARAEAGGCPFSGMIAEMEAQKEEGIAWTTEAEARLANIPEFVRPMAKQGIEHYAKSNGHAVVDDSVMEEARGKFGM